MSNFWPKKWSRSRLKLRAKVKVNILLQTASTEMDVVTVATEASRFQDIPASRGMPNVPINTISMEIFTKRSEIVEIYVAIQEGSPKMGRGVSPQIGPCDGSTVMSLNVPNNVSHEFGKPSCIVNLL